MQASEVAGDRKWYILPTCLSYNKFPQNFTRLLGSFVSNFSGFTTEFNPGVGFIMRRGVQGMNGHLLYGWLPGEASKLFNYNFFVRGEKYNRIDDGGLESMRLSPGFEMNTKNGIHSELSVDYQKEGVLEDFKLSDSIAVIVVNTRLQRLSWSQLQVIYPRKTRILQQYSCY